MEFLSLPTLVIESHTLKSSSWISVDTSWAHSLLLNYFPVASTASVIICSILIAYLQPVRYLRTITEEYIIPDRQFFLYRTVVLQ